VLDAGSGEGYGAALLASSGATAVVGADVDPAAVTHARERYGLDFVEADLAELPFADSEFDLAVCFETIEHVADAKQALAELRRVLDRDGVLLISTPNPAEYLVDNEFHAGEFSAQELDRLLEPHFSQRMWLYQQNWLLSALLDEQQFKADGLESPLDLDLLKAVGFAPGRELYAIAICGPVERVPAQVGVITGIFEANRLTADLNAWQNRARKAEDLRVGWEERAGKAEDNATAWEARAHEKEDEVERLLEGIRLIEASLSWRITKPFRATKALLKGRRERA
jgi:SAM-dependent methyltransferase